MWTYEQSTGRLLRNGQQVAIGYSGAGEGKNNPAAQDEACVGPIPRGQWRIGSLENAKSHGPAALPLFPCRVETHRTAFMIHGDHKNGPPGFASEGCIILPRDIREQIAASGDHTLEVI